jgi:uncharacterized protein with GYD domain
MPRFQLHHALLNIPQSGSRRRDHNAIRALPTQEALAFLRFTCVPIRSRHGAVEPGRPVRQDGRVANGPHRSFTNKTKGGNPMSHFMLRWQFSSASAKAMVGKPHDRTEQAVTLVKSFGGTLHHYFFAFGDYDGVAICEFPNSASVAACSMTAAATGAFARFETTVLLTAQEAETALRQAHDTKSGYKPPTA